MRYRELQLSIEMHFEALNLLYFMAVVAVCLARFNELLGGTFSEVTLLYL